MEPFEGRPHLKEWGLPATDDEIYEIADLEEFMSTDVDDMFRSRSREPQNLGYGASDIQTQPFPTKIPQLDTRHLVRLVPQVRFVHTVLCQPIIDASQPHLHPSPFLPSTVSPRIPPFARGKLIPIPPYTLPFPDPPAYARHAWIIPIRGNPPWDNCTSATLLESSEKIPVPSGPGTGIVWTHSSVAALWEFLLVLRQNCSVGSLGVSFQAARSQPANPSDEISGAHSYSDMGFAQVVPGLDGSMSPTHGASLPPQPIEAPRPPLAAIDHIKVYHDATFSMHLRNALHVWGFDPKQGNDKPIRIFKGAKLVLVNEKSRGVCIV